MDYLTQLKIYDMKDISMDTCNGYLKTQAGYSFKTVEQNVCGVRHFLSFLLSTDILMEDLAEKIHMPPFDSFSDNDHLGQRIKYYMQKAGVNVNEFLSQVLMNI